MYAHTIHTVNDSKIILSDSVFIIIFHKSLIKRRKEMGKVGTEEPHDIVNSVSCSQQHPFPGLRIPFLYVSFELIFCSINTICGNRFPNGWQTDMAVVVIQWHHIVQCVPWLGRLTAPKTHRPSPHILYCSFIFTFIHSFIHWQQLSRPF